MKIALTTLLLMGITLNGKAQKLSIKTNTLNWILARPSLDIEAHLISKHSMATHYSSGLTFFHPGDGQRPTYSFQTITIDYFYQLVGTKNNKFKLRMLAYTGYIKRCIYDQEIKGSNFLFDINDLGRDFTGHALRFGMGTSCVLQLNNRFALEYNMGIGGGYYLRQQDVYYTNKVVEPAKFKSGYGDMRMAFNLCYRIL